MRVLQRYAIPRPQFDPPSFIYCAELVLSPLDLIVDVFEYVNTILLASTINSPPIKMWNCLTQHSKMHFSVRRRVFANSP